MTPRGAPFVRAVAAVFDPLLKASEGRHAKVI
jgi:hypothetical protein